MTGYAFNTRDIVQVAQQQLPPKLASLAGQRGIILYHTAYQSGIPSAEAILIGAEVVKTQNYLKTGRIDETIHGQIHIVPIECLAKVANLGAELDTDSVINGEIQ